MLAIGMNVKFELEMNGRVEFRKGLIKDVKKRHILTYVIVDQLTKQIYEIPADKVQKCQCC